MPLVSTGPRSSRTHLPQEARRQRSRSLHSWPCRRQINIRRHSSSGADVLLLPRGELHHVHRPAGCGLLHLSRWRRHVDIRHADRWPHDADLAPRYKPGIHGGRLHRGVLPKRPAFPAFAVASAPAGGGSDCLAASPNCNQAMFTVDGGLSVAHGHPATEQAQAGAKQTLTGSTLTAQ